MNRRILLRGTLGVRDALLLSFLILSGHAAGVSDDVEQVTALAEDEAPQTTEEEQEFVTTADGSDWAPVTSSSSSTDNQLTPSSPGITASAAEVSILPNGVVRGSAASISNHSRSRSTFSASAGGAALVICIVAVGIGLLANSV
jgi:hypothetical protein